MTAIFDKLLSSLKIEKTIITTFVVGLLCALLFLMVAYRYGSLGSVAFTMAIIFFCIIIFSLKTLHLKRYFPAILFVFALFPLRKTIGIVSISQIDFALIAIYIISLFNNSPSTAKSRHVKQTHFIMVAMLFWLFVSSLMSLSPATSLGGMIPFIRFFLLYYLFSNLNVTSYQIKILLIVIVLSVLLEGSLGAVQYALKSNIGSLADSMGESQDTIRLVGSTDNLHRSRGTFSYDTALGAFFEMFLPMVFSMLFIRQYRKYRIVLIMIMILGLLGLLFTFTRGAWFGTIIGFCITIYYMVRNGYFKFPKLILGFILALVLIVPLSTFFSPLIQDRLFGSSSRDSLNTRAYVYSIAIKATLDHPLFGVGLNNLGIYSGSYGMKAHNILIQLSCETGILGAVIFAFWLFYVLKTAHRNITSSYGGDYAIISIGLCGGIIALIVHNMFAWNMFSQNSGSFFWITAGLINSIASQNVQMQNIKIYE